jgi:carbamoyl-phosphate synthase large subunit
MSTRNATAAPVREKAISQQELNILFTCAGRRVALLHAFRRAMDKLGVAGKIVASDKTYTSSAFQSADVGELLPPVGRIEYIPAMLDLVAKHRIGLVVPLTDLDLRSLGRQKHRFAEAGAAVMIGDEQDIRLCRDKAATNELFGRAGLGTIKTLSLQEFYREPFYPCFVKPIRGSAGIATGVITNEKELRAHIATYGELLLVQEYVPGQEYTIDMYRDREGVVRCAVPRQRLAVRAGEVSKGIAVKDDQLIEASVKLAGLLGGVWGVFCAQCRRQEGGKPRFFEVNPRFGGGAPLSIAAGADLPLYLLQEVLGRPITAKLGEFTDQLLMLRYDEAVFVQVSDQKSLPGYDTPSFKK